MSARGDSSRLNHRLEVIVVVPKKGLPVSVSIWLFAVTLAWAVVVTVFLFWRNPLPWPDCGHRCFAVKDEKTAGALISAIGKSGLKERFTFDPGPTHQTLLRDNSTVFIWYEQEFLKLGLPRNALSVAVHDPLNNAYGLVARLVNSGSKNPRVLENVIPEYGDKFVLVTCDDFDGWMLLFRRHGLALGKPPNMRKNFS